MEQNEKYKIQDAVLIGSYEEIDKKELSSITHNQDDKQILDGLILRGYETKFNRTNENGERYTKEALDDFLENYFIKNKLNMPLTIQHKDDIMHIVGRVLIVEVNSVGFYFVCYIPRAIPQYAHVKALIEEGVLQGLSKEGWATDFSYKFTKDGDVDYVQINKMDLLAMSIVTTPANAVTFERVQEIKNTLRFNKIEEEKKGSTISEKKLSEIFK